MKIKLTTIYSSFELEVPHLEYQDGYLYIYQHRQDPRKVDIKDVLKLEIENGDHFV
jgi:hypothetical protein